MPGERLRRFLAERKPLLPRKKLFKTVEDTKKSTQHDDITQRKSTKQSKLKPVSGRTFEDQSNESYCLECCENHTMKALTEIGHGIDRFRSAGKMTSGVVEKVRATIGQLSGIDEDVKNTTDASPEVKEGLNEILDEVRWIRKDYGISGVGLTRGGGTLKDLEELRKRIFVLQTKAYALVEKCPTCKKISRSVGERVRA